jgi:hypothetical protein
MAAMHEQMEQRASQKKQIGRKAQQMGTMLLPQKEPCDHQEYDQDNSAARSKEAGRPMFVVMSLTHCVLQLRVLGLSCLRKVMNPHKMIAGQTSSSAAKTALRQDKPKTTRAPAAKMMAKRGHSQAYRRTGPPLLPRGDSPLKRHCGSYASPSPR